MEFLAALQTKASAQQAPLCDDANTVLELLCNTYYEHVCTDDTDEIKQAFDDLYQAMTGKAHREETKSWMRSAGSADCISKPALLTAFNSVFGWPKSLASHNNAIGQPLSGCPEHMRSFIHLDKRR